MTYIPITEAIKRLGRSDRQIRRMVHGGKLTYRYAADRKLEILASDIDKVIRQSRPPQEIERLDALEHELAALRQQIDALSNRIDMLTSPRKREPGETPRTQPGHSTMPEGLIGWRRFSRLHGVGESTTQAAIEAGRLDIVPGTWIVGKASVKGAFDQAGRAKFYELYHDNPRFKPCDECPHLLAGVS